MLIHDASAHGTRRAQTHGPLAAALATAGRAAAGPAVAAGRAAAQAVAAAAARGADDAADVAVGAREADPHAGSFRAGDGKAGETILVRDAVHRAATDDAAVRGARRALRARPGGRFRHAV